MRQRTTLMPTWTVFCLVILLLAKPTLADPSASELKGIWRSIGYGLVLEIDATDYTVYEVTSVSGVQSRAGKTESIERDFGSTHLSEDGQQLEVRLPYSLAPIRFARIDRLPDVCTDTSALTDPESLFEIVWHTFDENYAFFETRDVDWAEAYQRWRPEVTQDTTDRDLFRMIGSMVSQMNDYHVEVDAKGFDYSRFKQASESPLVQRWRREFAREQREQHFYRFVVDRYNEHVQATHRAIESQLTPQARSAAQGQLVWGTLPDRVGYLSVRSMAGFSDQAQPASQLGELSKAIDRAIEDLADTRGMVVDVRFNGGGWDQAALVIASRFADQRRHAFTKQVRDVCELVPVHTAFVEPGGAAQYTRPVVLLTSQVTASAAEIFTYAMKALPHVVHAGAATRGAHSDMLERMLPNGWRFYLSNEVYEDPAGRVYERYGIPPSVKIPMFTLGDLDQGRDQVLVQALALLDAPE